MQNRAMKERDESQVEGRVTYCKALRCKAVSRWRKWTTGFVTVDFHFCFGFIFSPFLSSQVIECNDNALQRLLNTSIRAFGYFWEHEMLFIVYGFGINRKKTPVLLRFEMCRINFVCVCSWYRPYMWSWIEISPQIFTALSHALFAISTKHQLTISSPSSKMCYRVMLDGSRKAQTHALS